MTDVHIFGTSIMKASVIGLLPLNGWKNFNNSTPFMC